ncbi:MAG TPA: hypothetical protein VFB01_09965 [Burkholderiales bacterium]|nr:hypothetical protein [Burkholderiales bacterium]
MSPTHTGALLLKCVGKLPARESLAGPLTELAVECVPLVVGIAAHAALEGDEACLYLYTREFGVLSPALLSRAPERARSMPAFAGVAIAAARLSPMCDCPGASRNETSAFHYVVETDVDDDANDADLNAWYDTEHMPGLAACPGTVRARRFRNPDSSPRYHACYDLVTKETLGSPRWLAVRNSAWSDRVRPHFRNTRRTMFRRLFHVEL